MKKGKLRLKDVEDICYPTHAQKKDIYRRLGIFPLLMLLKAGIVPNVITAARAFFLILGFFFLSKGIYSLSLWAAAIFHLCIFLDTFDGAIARYRKLSSRAGEMMDFMLDHSASTIIYALAAGLYILNTSAEPYILGSVIPIILIAQLNPLLRYLIRKRSSSFKNMREGFFMKIFYQDNNRHIVFLLTICSIFSRIDIFMIIYIIFNLVKVIYLSIRLAGEIIFRA